MYVHTEWLGQDEIRRFCMSASGRRCIRNTFPEAYVRYPVRYLQIHGGCLGRRAGMFLEREDGRALSCSLEIDEGQLEGTENPGEGGARVVDRRAVRYMAICMLELLTAYNSGSYSTYIVYIRT
jgi:hypothetical protein